MKVDIIKIAAIILKDGKLLIDLKENEDIWISIGGKLEPNETVNECLSREIKEELNVEMLPEIQLYHISEIEPAAGKKYEGKTVQITSYITSIIGDPKPSGNISKIHWLSKKEFLSHKYKLGSILENFVIPKLIEENLMY